MENTTAGVGYTPNSSAFLLSLSVSLFDFLDSCAFKMGPIGCPETTLRNYHFSLRNNSEERNSHLVRGGSLKSRVI
jgi:hypothetical protein